MIFWFALDIGSTFAIKKVGFDFDSKFTKGFRSKIWFLVRMNEFCKKGFNVRLVLMIYI